MFFTDSIKNHIKLINSCCDNINNEYINLIINDDKNILLLYANNDSNIIGFLIYQPVYNAINNRYYILLFGVKKIFRNYGYGNAIITMFINYVNDIKTKYKKQIIVHALESNINFYTKNGFKCDNKHNYCLLQTYEGNDISNVLIYTNFS